MSTTFDIPVRLPDGRTLWTTQEARQYVAGLSADQRASQPWQNAIAEIDRCDANAGPWLFITPVAVMRAINGSDPFQRPTDATGLTKREREALAYKTNRAAYRLANNRSITK